MRYTKHSVVTWSVQPFPRSTYPNRFLLSLNPSLHTRSPFLPFFPLNSPTPPNLIRTQLHLQQTRHCPNFRHNYKRDRDTLLRTLTKSAHLTVCSRNMKSSSGRC